MRALIYDQTQGALSHIWAKGSVLYRSLGRLDAARGVTTWEEALDWLASLPEPIAEIQFWGHGLWGRALVNHVSLDASSLHTRRCQLEAVREHLADDALIWFRTCQTFGARAGHEFAARYADFFGARVAGHTHVIGFHQSGLHGLRPGQRAHWSLAEGVRAGTSESPTKAHRSALWRPHTITALKSRVPEAWFASGSREGSP